MANKNGRCPKCGGELSIPEELARFSCMYCGAVLTQEYADRIGADFYGKDAMASVRYATELKNLTDSSLQV